MLVKRPQYTGVAMQLYWNDNDGQCFTTRTISTNGGVIHWCGWLDWVAKTLYPYANKLRSFHFKLEYHVCLTCSHPNRENNTTLPYQNQHLAFAFLLMQKPASRALLQSPGWLYKSH